VRILVVGASGNLGSQLTRRLLTQPYDLRLLRHRSAVPFESGPNCEIVDGDLDNPASLRGVCNSVDCVVYAAGVLFRPRPASFLRRTNTIYAQNLIDAALAAGTRKFIFTSFPHVEENTTPEAPGCGLLNVEPRSIHARTRLDAEKYLFRICVNQSMRPVVLRAGVVYGRGVKLTEAARWLLRRRLLAVWHRPTWIHLLALPDLLRIVEIAIKNANLFGIYNICDDQPVLLQEFLDRLADHWGCAKPYRIPAGFFLGAATFCEMVATLFRTGTPLTRDMIRMAMTSVVADTSRMKREIVSTLLHPTLTEGLRIC
jgi:nucleoside-diphosphate-sugar epimerase